MHLLKVEPRIPVDQRKVQKMISYMIHSVPKKTYHLLRETSTLLCLKSVIHAHKNI